MKLPRKSENTKISRYCGEIAISSSRVPMEVSAALFRRSGKGSVGFSVLFMRNVFSFLVCTAHFSQSLYSVNGTLSFQGNGTVSLGT